ncbi:MAG TPA: SirB2 family protein [Rhodanobacteraceae bacterium]|nr:SirB2 family protein [Rhodanobacteraceae bacterium]
MNLAAHYLQIRDIHVAAVIASGSLFCTRGALALARWPYVMHPVLRYGSMAIDTVLLGAGITLMFVIRQYPFVDGWLTMKLALLVVYIALGTFALKRACTQGARATCYLLALATFAYIVSVAIAHDPKGVFTFVRLAT